ncbi:MAG: Ig-like domain-containing protein, partial [Nitrospirae bacterium]|nr:Ig-like domain-containing protein [Nitrospirota bacterium]
DSDPNSDPLTAVLDTNASNGTVVLNADGSFTYTPTGGFSGTDSFTYHAHDGALDSNVVTVTLTLNGVPVANADSATTVADVGVAIAVLTNDTDDTGLNAASVTVQSGPTNGTSSVDGSTGAITYTPTLGYVGADSFTYTVQDLQGLVSNTAMVTVTVQGGNEAPVAGDDSATTLVNAPVVIPVLTTDTDDTGLNAASVVVQSGPSHGSTSVDPGTGEITYSPTLDYVGPDVFTYTVQDIQGQGSNLATVTVTVVAGLPLSITNLTVESGKTYQVVDEGLQDGAKIYFDQSVIFTNLAPDLAGLTYIMTSNFDKHSQGTTFVSFDVNQPVTVLVGHDQRITPKPSWLAGWTLTGQTIESISGPNATYDVYEQESPAGTVTLGGNHETTSGASMYTIIIRRGVPENQAPVATAESYSGTQDTQLSMAAPGVLTNDSDPNSDPLTAVLDTNASNGTVVLNADGSFTYTPTGGFSGTDSFTYHAHDGALDSNSVTVILNINGAPVANNDSATTVAGVAVNIGVLTNDTDDGGLNAASVTVVSGPTNGTTSVNSSTGAITYTPAAGYVGVDSFTYTVVDLQGITSNVAVVTVTVNEASSRVEAGLVVYYPLTEGSGTVVQDQSGIGAPLDLTLGGTVNWASDGNGLVFAGGKAQSSGAATKVIDALQTTNQSTMEVWVQPANISQSGPARMVSIGGDPSFQNYVLGQQGDEVQVRYLNTGKDRNAKPRLQTNDNSVATELIHIVHTYDGTTERVYVNGVENPTTLVLSGVLSNWDPNDPLTLGNEGSGDRPWAGTMRLMAVYDRTLTPAEIQQNFNAGSTGQ